MPLPILLKRVKEISLQNVFLIPFAGLILFAVVLVSYLSFRNGQQSVVDVSNRLRNEINIRIEKHLEAFLSIPQQINRSNFDAIRRGILDVEDRLAMTQHFWDQIRTFDSVTSISFGNPSGGIANSGREGARGALYVIFTDDFVSGPLRKYAIDSHGELSGLLVTVPGFDSRKRPWYINAVNKGNAAWSEIYVLFTGGDMAITASRAVYDERQKLLGVVAVDLFLSQIGNYLAELDVGKTGQSFIMDRSGFLVATSTGEKPYVTTASAGATSYHRIEAGKSSVALTRRAAEALVEQFGEYKNVLTQRQFEFDIDGKRQLAEVTPFHDRFGLDWLIVTVIPEDDFMAQINVGNRITIILVLIVLIIALLMSIFISRKIVKPLTLLNVSAEALANGEWDKTIQIHSRIKEINTLSNSFNYMVVKLQETVMGLNDEIVRRSKAEEEFMQSEHKYQTLAENIKDVIWVLDLETLRFLYVSPSVLKMRGYTPEEVMSESVYASFIPETSVDIIALMKQGRDEFLAGRLSSDNFFTQEIEQPCRDGSTVWAECIISFMSNPDTGRPELHGVTRDISDRKRDEEKLISMSEKLKVALTGTIQAISKIVDVRDPYTAGHQKRVADLAGAIAEEMGMDKDQAAFIRLVGNIHDIGKISVPAEILSKPGKLSHIEFELVKTHAQTGYEMLKEIEFPGPVADIILQHHERVDGSGYPNGLMGYEMMPEALIMAVADVVESIASHRPYRASLGIEAALEEIEKNSGILYDSAVVDACLVLIREKQYRLIDIRE